MIQSRSNGPKRPHYPRATAQPPLKKRHPLYGTRRYSYCEVIRLVNLNNRDPMSEDDSPSMESQSSTYSDFPSTDDFDFDNLEVKLEENDQDKSLHVRKSLTTSMFYATAAVSALTVAAPQLIGCPAHRQAIGADTKDEQD